MTNRVAIDKAVIVRSVNGPNLTWIVGQGAGGSSNTNGDGAIRCVYLGVKRGVERVHPDQRAYHDWRRLTKERAVGGLVRGTSGVVTNCTLTGNSAFRLAAGRLTAR